MFSGGKEILDYLNNPPPGLLSCLIAMLIAFLRVIYDKKETSRMRMFLESLFCGAITFTVWKAITALGLNPDWAVFAGGVIGLLGSEFIRSLARKTITEQVEQISSDKHN